MNLYIRFIHPTENHEIEDFVAITTAFLLIDPGQDLFDRVTPYFGKYMNGRNHEVANYFFEIVR